MATTTESTSITAPGLTGALVTSISVTRNGSEVLDASHLGQAYGSAGNFYASPYLGTTEVSVSFIGDSIPDAGDTGALTVTGAISVSLANCLCTSASVTGSAGELITGDATFTLID